MDLKNQKRLAAQLLNVGINKVVFDNDKLDEIKEAITKADIRMLISNGIVWAKPKKGISRSRTRKRLAQKRKGRRQGSGSRKGKQTARLSRKSVWMNKIRVQRGFLRLLKDKRLLSNKTYRDLYKKAKSGLFRSKRHIKLYIEENKLFNKK